jgi:DNA-binding GntR family transcriptional regulator
MEKHNLEEQAFQAIMGMIVEHQFKPGDFLLETELTDRLKMRSRTPVRHALTQLVAQGFLEKKKKKGDFIPFPSREDAEHVFFAREYIEGLNAASAARHRTEEDLLAIKALIADEASIGREGKKGKYSSINESFHRLIARMSKNPYLEQYSRHLFWRSSFYIFYFGSYYTEEDFVPFMLSPPQHQAIVAAITEADSDKARELMQHHVRFTCERIITKIGF